MMQMDQTRPAMTVSRSRLRSTTEEPDRLEYSEPPNIDDRPPPLPRCSNTRTISIRLARIRTIDSNVIIMGVRWPRSGLGAGAGLAGRVPRGYLLDRADPALSPQLVPARVRGAALGEHAFGRHALGD